ncbi:MAG: hypothetical protein J5965_28430 [Aeriscardovia sp.]|nr:hypothetical protein [Aeriscardovia sp.]
MENKSKFHLVKENSFLILCVCFFALFVILAAVSGAWPGKDISAQFFSAMAGALVAAIITLFLLKGQTAVEADRQKNSKVFEEKLGIYKEFLSKLCDVVKDQKITPEEEIELQFQVSCIAMHTKSASIKSISEQVRKIIVDIKNHEKDSNNMLSQLFVISDALYKELYDKDNSFDEEDRSKTIVNFESILAPKNDSRLYELMQNIIAKGSNKRIDRNGILIYEYWCNNKDNRYIKTNGSVSIGISCNNMQYSFSIMAKGNHPEKFLAMVQGVCDESKLFKKDANANFIADVGTDDGRIVDFFNLLLSKMKKYRETDFPE